MYKARQYLSKCSLLNLYYAYIYPYMTYCIEIWGTATQTYVIWMTNHVHLILIIVWYMLLNVTLILFHVSLFLFIFSTNVIYIGRNFFFCQPLWCHYVWPN